MIDVSIVVPMYNEEESVGELVRRVTGVMRETELSWELIVVNDGSTDASGPELDKLAEHYPELRPLHLKRNSGQTAAMQAGFDHAFGEVFITMDGDLQNDPADIPRLISHLKASGADVVSGWRKNRQDHFVYRTFPSRIANALISKVTGVRLHDYGCSLKAYRRDAIENVKIYGEMHRFIPAVVAQYGAKVEELVVTHHARKYGNSKYGIDRTFRVLLDLLAIKFFLQYLHRPMHAFGMVGMICLALGFLISAYLTATKLFMGADIGDRPLLLLGVMMIILGVQMLSMGILGELLVRIYHEPKGRKQYVLRDPQPQTSEKTFTERLRKVS